MHSMVWFPSALPSDLATLWTLVSIPGQAYTSWAQVCPKHQAAEAASSPRGGQRETLTSDLWEP